MGRLCGDPERHPAAGGAGRPASQRRAHLPLRHPRSLPASAPHGPHPEVTRTDRGSRRSPPAPVREVGPSDAERVGDPPFFPPCTCPKPKHSHHGRGIREPCGGRTPSPRGAAVTLQCETDPVALALSPPPGSCAGVRGVRGYRPGWQKDTGASWEIEEPEFGSVPPPTHSVTQRK